MIRRPQLVELHVRKRIADCSHTETVFIMARGSNVSELYADADHRLRKLMPGWIVKYYGWRVSASEALAADDERIPQEYCGCGESITWEVGE